MITSIVAPSSPALSPYILIVDDALDVRQLISRVFRRQLPKYPVKACSSATNGLDTITRNGRPSLILLDLYMPDHNGFYFLTQLKERFGVIPTIMLTSETSGQTARRAIEEFEVKDFIRKPFDSGELVARVQRTLKQSLESHPTPANSALTPAKVYVNIPRQLLFLNDRPIQLSRIEIAIVALLIARRGKPVSTEEISETIWDTSGNTKLNNVFYHIHELRKKIEDSPSMPTLVRTRRGEGYSWQSSSMA